ncbi:MAG: hypothetical protein NXI04_14765 [Planctomycetaceae bacterium]|nr:hypothetical protein [Planctomycetaceae bacterium]
MPHDEKITLYFASKDLAKARHVAEKVGADTVQKFGVKAIRAFVNYFEWASENGFTVKNALGEEMLPDRAEREASLVSAIRMLAEAIDQGEKINTAYVLASLNIK